MFIWCTGLTSIGGSCRIPSITSWTCSQTCKLRCELLTHLPKLTRTVPMLGFLHPDDQMSILYHRVPDISSVNTNLPVVSPRFHHRIRWSTCFSPQWVKQTPSVRKTIQLLCLEILLHHCWAPMYGWYTKGFPWQTPTSAIWLVVSTHPRNVITNYHPSNCSHESNPNLPKFGKVISSTEFQPYDFVLVAFFEHVQRCSKPSHAHHAPWGTSPRALVASGGGPWLDSVIGALDGDGMMTPRIAGGWPWFLIILRENQLYNSLTVKNKMLGKL